jgi:hypothetical protein
MSRPGGPHDFVYVHTHIPEGMTIREWRRERAAEHESVRRAERTAARERRRALLGWPGRAVRHTARRAIGVLRAAITPRRVSRAR